MFINNIMNKQRTTVFKQNIIKKTILQAKKIDKHIISEKYTRTDSFTDKSINIKLSYDSKLIDSKTLNNTISRLSRKYYLSSTISSSEIFISGLISNISSLFQTPIHEYTDGEKLYYSSSDDLTIPKELYFIDNIMGLSNIPSFHPYCILNSTHDIPTITPLLKGPKILPRAAPRALSSFTPPELANLYKFPTGYTGLGQTIAIIELGGGYRQSDMDYYFGPSGLNLPYSPTIIPISINGAVNNPDDTSGANYEVVLDIQIAAAIAPRATILVYFAPNSDSGFYNAIAAAINNTEYRPSIISISWGAPEAYWYRNVLSAYNSLFASAVAKKINIFAASGDNGSSDGLRGVNADFPSSSPNVVSCGGTTLTATRTVIQNEIVWNRNGGATGGGYSAVFSKPAYQSKVKGVRRGVPDVCANADPATGYKIYIDGSYVIVGGTSAVSPLLAGLTALLNEAKGTSINFMNSSYFYPKSSIFCVDIISGSNGAYRASKGWDPCSGNGRINGIGIIPNL
jgi:kumamolisin